VSTLGGGCKEDEAVAMKTKDSAMIFPLEGHPLERIRARSIDPQAICILLRPKWTDKNT
jgi:hypothetical protein